MRLKYEYVFAKVIVEAVAPGHDGSHLTVKKRSVTASPYLAAITAWARTGNVPMPLTFGGTAKKRKPSAGR